MSEQAEVQEVVTPEVPTPAKSIQELRSELSKASPEPARHDIRDSETGQFVSAETPEAPQEATPETGEGVAPADAIEGEAPAVVEAPAEAPPDLVEIEVPEGHWLRDRGKEKLPPVTKEWEAYFKGMLADPVRKSQLEAAENRYEQAEMGFREAMAAAEFWQDKAMFFAQNPEVALRVEQIKDTMGEDEANRYVAGLMQEDAKNLDTKISEARQTAEHASAQRDAQAFINFAMHDLSQLYPDRPRGDLENMVAMYGAQVAEGKITRLHKDTMRQFAESFYGKPGDSGKPEPEAALETFTKQQLEEAVQKARDEATAAVRRGQNPLGRISGTAPGTPPVNPSATPPSADSSHPNVREARRSLRRL